MSDLIVKVSNVKEVSSHPNAESLEILIVGGWQVVVKKDLYKVGDEVIHVPVDSLVPWEIAEKWGVANYLSGYDKYKNNNESVKAGRVKAIRLRGEISHGFVVPNDCGHLIDSDVKEIYGITKWEPEDASWSVGNAEKSHKYFSKYNDIQNYRNFNNIFVPGEEVIATEKIHGTNSAIGIIKKEGEEKDKELMIGSRTMRRKIGQNSLYEQPLFLVPELEKMLNEIYDEKEEVFSVICYGEIYGWVQDLRYGHDKNQVSFIAFDIAVNGLYMNYDEFILWTKKYNIPTVPEIYRGPFDQDKMWELSQGKTLISMKDPHMREGIVVRPVIERTNCKISRVILKMVSNEYLTRRGGSEHH